MPIQIRRRMTATLAAVAALSLATLIVASPAGAATIYGCVKKRGGAVRIVAERSRCKRSEIKIAWNVEGPAGKNGTNGRTGKTGFNGKNGANGTNGTNGTNGASLGLNDVNKGPITLKAEVGDQAVATLSNVPAGGYILFAKTQIENLTGAGVHVTCKLQAGGELDESAAFLAKSGQEANIETLPFTLGVSFGSTGTVTLTCNDAGATDVVVGYAEISAIQVQALTRTTG